MYWGERGDRHDERQKKRENKNGPKVRPLGQITTRGMKGHI